VAQVLVGVRVGIAPKSNVLAPEAGLYIELRPSPPSRLPSLGQDAIVADEVSQVVRLVQQE
jgi:hypothetical protein